MSLIIVGGNRKFEDEPLKSIVSYSRELNLNLIVITDKIHLNKECKNFKSLKEFLQFYKVNYFVFNNINLELNRLNKLINIQNSYLLAVNSIWIFKEEIIKLFKKKIFNLHIGKLPNQKGAGGASWQIMSQEETTAVTIHELTEKVDEGKILFEKTVYIRKKSSLLEYYQNANQIEKVLLKRLVNMVNKRKQPRLRKINNRNSIYMPRLDTKTHGFINWEWKGIDIFNFIRAFDQPYSGASTLYKNKLIHIQKVDLIDKHKIFHPFQSGIILRINTKSVYLAINNGILKISKITDKKGNIINFKNIKLGERFHTPIKFLENAKKKKSLHLGQGIKIKNA
jgi:methionyl-tRNA formyltransferase